MVVQNLGPSDVLPGSAGDGATVTVDFQDVDGNVVLNDIAYTSTATIGVENNSVVGTVELNEEANGLQLADGNTTGLGMPAGSLIIYTITGQVPATPLPLTAIEANVTSTSTDLNRQNNTANADTELETPFTFSFDSFCESATVGQVFEYSISAVNNGNEPIAVRVRHQPPEQLTRVTYTRTIETQSPQTGGGAVDDTVVVPPMATVNYDFVADTDENGARQLNLEATAIHGRERYTAVASVPIRQDDSEDMETECNTDLNKTEETDTGGEANVNGDNQPGENGQIPPANFPADVNGDEEVTPLDALIVINFLNRDSQTVDLKLDVNGDNVVTPLDALRVINYLNRGLIVKTEPRNLLQPDLYETIESLGAWNNRMRAVAAIDFVHDQQGLDSDLDQPLKSDKQRKTVLAESQTRRSAVL